MGCAAELKGEKCWFKTPLSEGDELTIFLAILCISVVGIQGRKLIINLNWALVWKGGWSGVCCWPLFVLYMRQRETHKDRTWEEQYHMLFSLQVNGVTTSEWSHSSFLCSRSASDSCIPSCRMVQLIRGGWSVHPSEMAVVKAALLCWETAGSNHSKFCLLVWDVHSVSNIKGYGNEHCVL